LPRLELSDHLIVYIDNKERGLLRVMIIIADIDDGSVHGRRRKRLDDICIAPRANLTACRGIL
jgi:hypothetical protein